jgi:hypothetical protein
MSASDSALHSFIREIGWKSSLLNEAEALTEEWQQRLDELFDLCGRPASWSSDAVGTIPIENGERWLVQYRTFRDTPRIWRVYERIHPDPNLPTFRIARRSSEMKWDGMGYFCKWSPNWTRTSGGLLRQLIEDRAPSNGNSGRSGKRRKKTDGIT